MIYDVILHSLTFKLSMWSILHMTVTSFVAAVAPRTGKIIKMASMSRKFAT